MSVRAVVILPVHTDTKFKKITYFTPQV
jgi:hypothetical protein